jgi:hypothetical protein
MFSNRKTTAILGLAAVLLFGPCMAPGQQAPASAGSSQASAATRKSPHHRARPLDVQARAPQEQPVTTPETEMPKWPVNTAPNKPSVSWDSSGLKIEANNSSLHEILNEVSSDTGAKVEGMGADERVFGQYGPGAARDVISQLLHGSSYNVLMIGDQGAGTPRQIVLSTRRSGGNQPQANRTASEDQADEDIPDQAEEDQGQPPMLNGRPPMPMVPQVPPGMPQGPQGAPRTPQQVLQELQQRQQQIQDLQQQQQQPQ